MKFLFSFLLLAFSFSASFAQSQDPVRWTVSIQKTSEPDTYTITAKASIEHGWHIFTPTPGGDGFLIGSSIQLNLNEHISDVQALKTEGKPINKYMDEIGDVEYFEDQAILSLSFRLKSSQSVSGTITHQSCNDVMCLPPTETPFNISAQ